MTSILGLALARRRPRDDGRSRDHAHDAVPGRRGRARLEPELRHLGHDRQARSRRPRGRQACRPTGRRPCAVAGSRSTASNRPAARRPTKVTLNVTVPTSATAGTQRIDVKGTTSSGSSATLSVDIRVEPNAAGQVTLTTDTPQRQGRLGRELHVQPDADQRHTRGLAVQCRGDRAGRLDRDRTDRVDGPGGERGGQGRCHVARLGHGEGLQPMPPPGRTRSGSTSRAGATPPTRTSRSRSPAATSSPSRRVTDRST